MSEALENKPVARNFRMREFNCDRAACSRVDRSVDRPAASARYEFPELVVVEQFSGAKRG
jgi:hypothetical protein